MFKRSSPPPKGIPYIGSVKEVSPEYLRMQIAFTEYRRVPVILIWDVSGKKKGKMCCKLVRIYKR